MNSAAEDNQALQEKAASEEEPGKGAAQVHPEWHRGDVYR